MKTIKLRTKVGIGTKIKVYHNSGLNTTTQTIISLSTTDRWYTDLGYYINKDFTIPGPNDIIATWVPLLHNLKYLSLDIKGNSSGRFNL